MDVCDKVRKLARAMALPSDDASDATIDLWLNQFAGKGFDQLKELSEYHGRLGDFLDSAADLAFPDEALRRDLDLAA